jgi:hypothetical protein
MLVRTCFVKLVSFVVGGESFVVDFRKSLVRFYRQTQPLVSCGDVGVVMLKMMQIVHIFVVLRNLLVVTPSGSFPCSFDVSALIFVPRASHLLNLKKCKHELVISI